MIFPENIIFMTAIYEFIRVVDKVIGESEFLFSDTFYLYSIYVYIFV